MKKTPSMEFWAYCRENSTKTFKFNRSNFFPIILGLVAFPAALYFSIQGEADLRKRNKATNRTI
jgi:hypothetical protein